MNDCAKRIRGRVKIPTDGHRVQMDAVEGAFGADVEAVKLRHSRRFNPTRRGLRGRVTSP